jgi:hypothetical protein
VSFLILLAVEEDDVTLLELIKQMRMGDRVTIEKRDLCGCGWKQDVRVKLTRKKEYEEGVQEATVTMDDFALRDYGEMGIAEKMMLLFEEVCRAEYGDD